MSTRTLRIVCTSDTHNDTPTPAQIPSGDVFIHAGDMTDNGTYDELKTAYEWIAALPHEVKIVIAGNHDLTLDPFHSGTTRASHFTARNFFTSQTAQEKGIIYLDTEVRRIPVAGTSLKVYANPHQPQWLPTDYSFTYTPHPSPESRLPWENAPNREDDVPIWITHGAPRGHLDEIPIPQLEGCEVQREKVYKARPVLCVFGHFHVAYGIEKVEWKEEGGVKTKETITNEEAKYDLRKLRKGKETVFANVAWMTGKKRLVEERNKPVVVELEVPVRTE